MLLQQGFISFIGIGLRALGIAGHLAAGSVDDIKAVGRGLKPNILKIFREQQLNSPHGQCRGFTAGFGKQ